MERSRAERVVGDRHRLDRVEVVTADITDEERVGTLTDVEHVEEVATDVERRCDRLVPRFGPQPIGLREHVGQCVVLEPLERLGHPVAAT